MWTKTWAVMLPNDNTRITLELGEMIEGGVDVWAFDYPSYYQGAEKAAFEQLVIDHFRFRQIGQETPGRWLHYFRTRIREIMPYYIQLYKSVELMEAVEDPFEAYNLREEYTESRSGAGKVTGSTTDSHETTTHDENEMTVDANGQNVLSRTPQGTVSNVANHMSEATTTEDARSENETRNGNATVQGSGSSETLSEDSGEMSYTLTRRGNIGVQPLGKEVQALREAFLNIDLQIINELNDLFLAVY